MHNAAAPTIGDVMQQSNSKTTKSSAADRPPSPILINQEGKLYARLLAKDDEDVLDDLSTTTPSFRIYYDVAPRAVPFLWELQPGTPKVSIDASASAAAQVPPLTPPPSLYINAKPRPKSKTRKRRPSRFSLLAALFRRFTWRKPWLTRRHLSTHRPSSPISSVVSSPFSRLESANSRQLGSSFSSRGEDEYELASDDDASARSVLCFRVQRIPCANFLLRRRRRT